MDAVLSIGPYDAEQAAGVEFAQVYRCFVPVQETQGQRQGELAAVSREAAPREASQGKGRPQRGHKRYT